VAGGEIWKKIAEVGSNFSGCQKRFSLPKKKKRGGDGKGRWPRHREINRKTTKKDGSISPTAS